MPVNITSSYGYFYLDGWVLANILQMGTQSFCERFVTYEIDPGRRMFDQMTLAARSVPANVAEGASRRNTSVETEMRLTDVGRGSLGELQGDYMNFLLKHCRAEGFYAKKSKKSINSIQSIQSKESSKSTESPQPNESKQSDSPIWSIHSSEYRSFSAIRLDRPNYSADLLKDVSDHILRQKEKFDPWIENANPIIAANSLMYLCARIVTIVRHQLEAQLERFKAEGGFRENMTETRLQAKQEAKQQQNAPTCPKCGAPMEVKMCKSGTRSGKRFWGCTNHFKTGCDATINID